MGRLHGGDFMGLSVGSSAVSVCYLVVLNTHVHLHLRLFMYTSNLNVPRPDVPGRLVFSALNLGLPVKLLRSAQLQPGELLFDGGGESDNARFSALCLHPVAQLTHDSERVERLPEALRELERFTGCQLGHPPAARSQLDLPCPVPLTACLLSYELGAPPPLDGVDELSRRLSALPRLWAARYEACYVWDQLSERGWVIGWGEEALSRATERLSLSIRATEDLSPLRRGPLSAGPLQPSWGPREHAAATLEAQRLMREGEVYQVNLTCAMNTTLLDEVSPEEVYLRLRDANPAPFGVFLRLDEQRTVLSQSPERLLRWSALGEVSTEPIKGTRPRSHDPQVDLLRRQELLNSLKDRAEHTMIVDLERNDLGRVCAPGTVRVDSLRALRSFPTLHHLVSVVSGQLRPEVGLAELLEAVFPGGSITGAPKQRAMEVIRRLETHPRGVYCGAMGYLSPDGSGDLNLPIRTCWIEGQALTYHAGGGVVADSTPEGEWAELWTKAHAVSRGLSGELGA